MRHLYLTAALCLGAASANAVAVNWTDWETSTSAGGFTASGTITSGSETIGVTYNNPLGVGFYYTGAAGETDFWTSRNSGRDPAVSPYTSVGANGADNIPVGTDIIALRYAGTQTLSFSQTIANPFFSFVSLNGNGYAFDRDFELLSSGGMNIDGNGIDECGYWGCGTSRKEVVEVSPGVFEYQLLGTGEPHGTLRFTGTFDTVSWRSLSNEYWNGFTVGVEGTADQVFPDPDPDPDPGVVPVPASLPLLAGALGLFGLMRRRG